MRQNDIEVISEFLSGELDNYSLDYLFSDYDVDSYEHEVIISNGDKQKVLFFKVVKGDCLLNIYDSEWSIVSFIDSRDFWIKVAPALWPEPTY